MNHRLTGLLLATALASGSSVARADDPAGASSPATSNDATERVPLSDPTGGAYTSPTLLFIPAAALPAWNVRVTALSELQTPSDPAGAPTSDSGVRPGAGVEVGLPAGFTASGGTNWVGGDYNAAGKQDFNLGLSPFGQIRYQILGDRSTGRGFLLGTSVTYKFVGFEGDPGETELALSAQYRRARWEAGVQAVVGKDFATTDADGEAHAYALYRLIPQLGVGAAGQIRDGLVIQPGEIRYDAEGGAIVSATLDRYQLGGLIGGSSLGLDEGHFGAFAQVFASARF